MAGLRYKGHIYAGVASYGNANEVNYDNTDSGLTATNVQEALNEVSANIDDLGADDVAYSNITSGLTATNVQDAVDEVVDDLTVSDWETITCSYGTIKARRNRNLVEFWMWSDQAIPTSTVLAILPSKFCPSIPSYPNDVRLVNGISSNPMKILLINNNGNISQNGDNNAGIWVEYHGMWFV